MADEDTLSGVAETALSETSTQSTPTPDTSADTGTHVSDATASPSDAQDTEADDHAGLLKVVQKAVKPDAAKSPEGEAVAVKPETPSQTEAQPQVDPLETDPSEQELGTYVPKTRKRVERLIQQRNSARTELETLREPAAKWAQMNGYLEAAQLAPEDVNLLLGVGAHLRAGRMREFRDAIWPFVRLANEALGDWLPQDIQQQVDNGEITRETGAELSRLRHANIRLEGRAKQTEAVVQQQRQQATSNVVRDAVVAWEQQVIAKDPDYNRKAAAVLRISQAIMSQEGAPATPAAALAIAQRAYEEASGWTRGWTPPSPPAATRPAPDSVRATNGSGARAEPRNLMEAAMLGLERSRRALH